MVNRAVDLAEKFSLFSGHFLPKVIARLNDYGIKLVRIKVSSSGTPMMTPTSCSWSSTERSPSSCGTVT